MKLYLSHSSSFDYQSEVYEPLKQTLAKKHEIFFPHDNENISTKYKDTITDSDIVLAEVSHPSTGQGIELGCADANNIPIVCFYRSDSKPSSSLKFVCEKFIKYSSVQDMTGQLAEYLD